MSKKEMAAARQVKKTEAGTEYQTEVLTKEVKRLKRSLTRQIGLFETLIQEADGKRVKQELEKLHLIFAELCSVSDHLQPLRRQTKWQRKSPQKEQMWKSWRRQ